MAEREQQGNTARSREDEQPSPRAQLVLRLVPSPATDSTAEVAPDKDDAYYAEVRKSVGRGTPTVLLGTSRKSLDRSLEKLRQAQRGG
jgi:hypothetical protein